MLPFLFKVANYRQVSLLRQQKKEDMKQTRK
jgi:hypothetical protein